MPEPLSPPGLEAAFVDGLTRFTMERDLAEYLIEQLGEAPLSKLKKAVRRLAAEQPWPVTAALLKLARYAADVDPSRETTLARLALAVASGVRLPESAKSALLFEAFALVGDGLRRQQQPRQAERAFAQAARHLTKAGDPHSSALYCILLAHLREDQGRHEECLALRDRAAALYQEIGQIDDQAEVLLDKANLEFDRHDVESAVVDLRTVITLADQGLRPDLVSVAVLPYVAVLRERRRNAEALAVLGAFHERYSNFADTTVLAELHLLEGSLLIFSNRPEVAEARLNAARLEFLRIGDPLGASSAALNLSLLLLLDGRRAPDLRALIEETLGPLAQAGHLPAQIRQSLEAFYAAIEHGTATAGLAGALLLDIDSTRNDGAARGQRSAGGGRDGQA